MNVIVMLPPPGAEPAAPLISDESRLCRSEGSACGVNSCSRQDGVQVRRGDECFPECQIKTDEKSPSPDSPHAVNTFDGASQPSIEASRGSQSLQYSMYPDYYLKGIAKLVRFIGEDKEIHNFCRSQSNGENKANEKVVLCSLDADDATKSYLKLGDSAGVLLSDNSSLRKKNTKVNLPFDPQPVDIPSQNGTNNFPSSPPLHDPNTSELVEFTGKFLPLKGWTLPIMAKKHPENKYVYFIYDSRVSEGKRILKEEEKSIVFSATRTKPSKTKLPTYAQENQEFGSLPTGFLPPKKKNSLPSDHQSTAVQNLSQEKTNSNVSLTDMMVRSPRNIAADGKETVCSAKRNKEDTQHDASASEGSSCWKDSNCNKWEKKRQQEKSAYQTSLKHRYSDTVIKKFTNPSYRDDQRVSGFSHPPPYQPTQGVSKPESLKEESTPADTTCANSKNRKPKNLMFSSNEDCASKFKQFIELLKISENPSNKSEDVPITTPAASNR